MEIEIADLNCENLRDAPEWVAHPFSCKYCIYWEFPEICVDHSKEVQGDLFGKKLNWLRNTREVFGGCGKIAYVNGKPIGYAEYASPNLLPRSYEYPSGPPSNDAVLIACLFIPYREFRGLGLGSQILRSIIKDLKGSGVIAVETFARKGNPDNPSGPLEFYLKNGFRVFRDDPEFPLMRLEL